MLTIEDITREIRSIFEHGGEFEFCNARRGIASCCRAMGHNGKHAHLFGMVISTENNVRAWRPTKMVMWK